MPPSLPSDAPTPMIMSTTHTEKENESHQAQLHAQFTAANNHSKSSNISNISTTMEEASSVEDDPTAEMSDTSYLSSRRDSQTSSRDSLNSSGSILRVATLEDSLAQIDLARDVSEGDEPEKNPNSNENTPETIIENQSLQKFGGISGNLAYLR